MNLAVIAAPSTASAMSPRFGTNEPVAASVLSMLGSFKSSPSTENPVNLIMSPASVSRLLAHFSH